MARCSSPWNTWKAAFAEFLREKGMAVETVLSPVLVLNDDTAFKYTITVDGKRYDPQIIIMGGN
jgi:hypothetical protein